MWSLEARQRINLEGVLLSNEGMGQFVLSYDRAQESYHISGYAQSSSGKNYGLCLLIPDGFPYSRPPLYLTDPHPLYAADGTRIASLGISHSMHTLAPHANGMIQICHWRDSRWHSGIRLSKVFLKGLLWIEAYEQHLATRNSIADFVRSMSEG
jgi:hypothetical protein